MMTLNKIEKRAILMMITAAVLWSTGGLLIKLVHWNGPAIAGFRSGVAALLMLFYLKKPSLTFDRNKFIGIAFYAGTLICFVSANKLTTAANAILLQFTSPVWVALLAGWLLKEKIRKSDWVTIAIVMCGMTLFFMGHLEAGQLAGNLLAILSGICFAFMIVFLKLQKKGSPVEIPFYGNILTFLICIPFMAQGNLPDSTGLIVLLVLGIFQVGISYILYAESVKHLSAVECVLIPVIEPLLNPIWVLLGTGETPSSFAIVGGIIVITTVIVRGVFLARQDAAANKTG